MPFNKLMGVDTRGVNHPVFFTAQDRLGVNQTRFIAKNFTPGAFPFLPVFRHIKKDVLCLICQLKLDYLAKHDQKSNLG